MARTRSKAPSGYSDTSTDEDDGDRKDRFAAATEIGVVQNTDKEASQDRPGAAVESGAAIIGNENDCDAVNCTEDTPRYMITATAKKKSPRKSAPVQPGRHAFVKRTPRKSRKSVITPSSLQIITETPVIDNGTNPSGISNATYKHEKRMSRKTMMATLLTGDSDRKTTKRTKAASAKTKKSSANRKDTPAKSQSARQGKSKQSGVKLNVEVYRGVPDDPIPGGWPAGWVKTVKQRRAKGIKTSGRSDPYWFTPVKRYRIRSLLAVKRFMELLQVTQGNEDEAYRMLETK